MPDTEPYVWVRDQVSGHSHPYLREALDLDKAGRYKPDEKHPVRDMLGRLLPTKFAADAAPVVDVAAKATTKEN